METVKRERKLTPTQAVTVTQAIGVWRRSEEHIAQRERRIEELDAQHQAELRAIEQIKADREKRVEQLIGYVNEGEEPKIPSDISKLNLEGGETDRVASWEERVVPLPFVGRPEASDGEEEPGSPEEPAPASADTPSLPDQEREALTA